MNIRVDLNAPIRDGTEVVFRSPVDCSQITGLIVYYNGESKEFAFADAHGNNVGDIDHLFAENVVVKVILDVTTGMAFVQNADTNSYLEQRINAAGKKLIINVSYDVDEQCTSLETENAYEQVKNAIEKHKPVEMVVSVIRNRNNQPTITDTLYLPLVSSEDSEWLFRFSALKPDIELGDGVGVNVILNKENVVFIEGGFCIFDDFENINNRVTTIDENSDDEHYPTAKAVYDYVSQTGGGSGGSGGDFILVGSDEDETEIVIYAEGPDRREDGYIEAGRLEFYAKDDDQPVRLRHLADGKREDDAATVRQLGYATPQMYGAKGDGVTDDTKAIKDCIAENNTIYFPRGQYLMTEPLVIDKNNLVIMGEDGETWGETKLVFKDCDGIVYNLGRYGAFKGVSIELQLTDGVENTYCGFKFNASDTAHKFQIENCMIFNFKYGISDSVGDTPCTIWNCAFKHIRTNNVEYAIHLGQAEYSIDNGHFGVLFEDFYSNGGKVRLSSGRFVFLNCNFGIFGTVEGKETTVTGTFMKLWANSYTTWIGCNFECDLKVKKIEVIQETEDRTDPEQGRQHLLYFKGKEHLFINSTFVVDGNKDVYLIDTNTDLQALKFINCKSRVKDGSEAPIWRPNGSRCFGAGAIQFDGCTYMDKPNWTSPEFVGMYNTNANGGIIQSYDSRITSNEHGKGLDNTLYWSKDQTQLHYFKDGIIMDAFGNNIESDVLNLSGSENRNKKLRNIADGVDDNDAATLGQVREMMSKSGGSGGGSFNDQEAVRFIESKTFRVGENLLSDNIVTSTGWTGSMANGFTHTSGNTEPLTFNIGAVDGERYIVYAEFGTTGEQAVSLTIGDSFPTDPYNGSKPILWGVQAVGDGSLSLKITPMKSTWTGTLKALKCQKITDDGEYEVSIPLGNLAHKEMPNHLSGFWDIQMGENALKDSINTTRCLGIGYHALGSLKTGGRNIGIGTYALPYAEYGENNIAIGADSAFEVQKATDCIVIGKAAMSYGKDLKNNIAIGPSALYGYGEKEPNRENESHDNIAIGNQAGYQTCSYNGIFIGKQAGYHSNDANAYGNIFIGSGAGGSSTYKSNGNRLVLIGTDTGVKEGKHASTVIGAYAKVDGGYGVAIGCNAKAVGSISTAIGYNAVADKNNQVVIGGDTVTETLVKGNLVVRGTDGVKRQIVFNEDGTCSWTAVE